MQNSHILYTIGFANLPALRCQQIWRNPMHCQISIIHSCIVYTTILVINIVRMSPSIIYHSIRPFSSTQVLSFSKHLHVFSKRYSPFSYFAYYNINYQYTMDTSMYHIPFDSPMFQLSDATSFKTIGCHLRKLSFDLIFHT